MMRIITMKISLFITVLTFCCSNLFAQLVVPGSEVKIKVNSDFKGFEILDSVCNGKRIFVSGENHMYVRINVNVELQLLKYFYKTQGVRHLIIELGSARADFSNQYISGDTSVKEYLEATTSRDYMKFYDRLQKWNLTLPAEERITIHGIDVERFCDLPVLQIANYFQDTLVPSSINIAVKSILYMAQKFINQSYDYYQRRDVSNEKSEYYYQFGYNQDYVTCKRFILFFDSLQNDFRTYLGSKFEATRRAVLGLREFVQFSELEGATPQYIWREENMYKKLSKLLDSMPKAKYYGQFGRCHIAYTVQNNDCGNWYLYKSTVNKIVNRYDPKNVLAVPIGIFYSNESSYYRGQRPEDQAIEDSEVNEYFKKLKRGAIKIFNLSQDTSSKILNKKYAFGVFIKVNYYDFDDGDTSLEEANTVKDYDEYDLSDVLTLNYAITNIQFPNVMDVIRQNFPLAANPSRLHGFSISRRMNADNWFGSTIHSTLFPVQSFYKNDSVQFGFGFGYSKFDLDINLIRSQRFNFAISPALGLGRQRFRYKQIGNLQSETATINNKLNRWNLGAGISTKLVFLIVPDLLGINVEAGYNYNIWNKNGWKLDGRIVNKNALPNAAIPFLTAGIAINIE